MCTQLCFFFQVVNSSKHGGFVLVIHFSLTRCFSHEVSCAPPPFEYDSYFTHQIEKMIKIEIFSSPPLPTNLRVISSQRKLIDDLANRTQLLHPLLIPSRLYNARDTFTVYNIELFHLPSSSCLNTPRDYSLTCIARRHTHTQTLAIGAAPIESIFLSL